MTINNFMKQWRYYKLHLDMSTVFPLNRGKQLKKWKVISLALLHKRQIGLTGICPIVCNAWSCAATRKASISILNSVMQMMQLIHCSQCLCFNLLQSDIGYTDGVVSWKDNEPMNRVWLIGEFISFLLSMRECTHVLT